MPTPAPRNPLLGDPILRNVPVENDRKVLGPCILEAELGRGGFGVVYKAWHRNLNIAVAVKCLFPALAEHDSTLILRFQREARIAASLQHPNLVRVFDVEIGASHGVPYLILEYVHGETAHARVVRTGAGLPVRDAVAILLGATRGLAAAHAKGVVHRDIKPGNILLAKEGTVKLTDLGLAKARDGGPSSPISQVIIGTPSYMPPEQWDGLTHVGLPGDVWALGATLYFLLAGTDPFPTGTPVQVGHRITKGEFPDVTTTRKDLPPSFLAVLRKCTQFGSQDRYADASELAVDLKPLAQELSRRPQAAGRATLPQARPAPRPRQRDVPGCTFLHQNAQGYVEYRDERSGLVFVYLSGGTFRMGSPDTEAGRDPDEGPVHEVELSPFLIAKHEVTQEVWERVMGASPSRFTAAGKTAPVEQMSWEDCVEFCKRTGLRLPTEAEWEYAARGGTTTAIHGASLDAIAWHDKNSGGTTHPVGQKAANAFGLHDMLGNVWEWCADVFDGETYRKRAGGAPAKDPVVTSGSSERVIRGGSWFSTVQGCRAACRFWGVPSNRSDFLGLRPARVVAP